MGKKKIGIIVAACAAIVICSSVIIGVTYALWNDRVTVNNHLSAGSLQVELTRESYSKDVTDSKNGTKTTKSDEKSVSLGNNSSVENVFGLTKSDLLLPGYACSAKLKLANKGDVAVDYVVSIKLDSSSDDYFAEKLIVYVNGDKKGALSSFDVEDGKIVVESSTVLKGKSSEFSVKVVFSEDATNDAGGKECSFDLFVTATQHVDK